MCSVALPEVEYFRAFTNRGSMGPNYWRCSPSNPRTDSKAERCKLSVLVVYCFVGFVRVA